MAKLTAGKAVPKFNAVDIKGNSITFIDSEHRYSLLCFFRYAGCPWCNLAIHELTKADKVLQKRGVQIVLFTPSDNELIEKNILSRHNPQPSFPIIADPTLSLFDKFKIENSLLAGVKSIGQLDKWIKASLKLGFPQSEIDGDLTLVPAQFLIDNKTGKIVIAHYGVNYADTSTFIDVYDKVLFR